MDRFRSRLLRPWVLVLALALASGGAYLAMAAREATRPAEPYPAWESPRLFTFPGEWTAVAPVVVRTIYPGQASWQWVTGSAHPGSASVAAGTACAACHGNPVVGASSVAGWAGPPADHGQSQGCQACHRVLEQQPERLGASVGASPELEPDPIEGKRPFLDVEVRAAFDAAYLYLRLEWASERPGIIHDLWRWDGERWALTGGPKPDAPKRDRMPSYEDRLSINVADVEIPAFDGARVGYAKAGCWIACHDSMRAMPREPAAEAVKADRHLGAEGLKQSDVRKYLLITRSRLDEAGGWNAVKPRAEIERLLERGQFLDMWMWRAARSGPIGYADDAFVLEYRFGDKGRGMFVENPLEQGRPRYVYDAGKVGFHAVPEARLGELLPRAPLVEGETAAPPAPNAGFAPGDLVSRRLLRTPEGSRADILANSRWERGRWVLELRRKLDTGQPDDKRLVPGRAYTIGIAVFDDMVSNRRHHVSFPVTLGLGTPADIVARPLAEGR